MITDIIGTYFISLYMQKGPVTRYLKRHSLYTKYPEGGDREVGEGEGCKKKEESGNFFLIIVSVSPNDDCIFSDCGNIA